MSASVTDKFRKASSGTRPIVTSLGSDKTNGSTTATIAAATGWNTTTGVDLIIYRTDTSGAVVAGSQTDWIATLSGTTLSNMTLKAGTEPATGYPAGAQSVVVCSPTAAWADSLIDGILIHADQDGTLKAGAVDVAAVLANDVVTTVKILDANVTNAKLATGAGEPGGVSQSYTPTITAPTTSPTLGNSTLTGFYKQIGKIVHANVQLTIGSTFSAGSGAYRFALPVAANTTNIPLTTNFMLSGTILDISASETGILTGAKLITSTTHEIIGGKASSFGTINGGFPFTWATGDIISFGITYEAA